MKAGPPLGGDSPDTYRISAKRVAETSLEEQRIRKTDTYRLKPTPSQAQVLGRTLMLCRHVYHAAVGERRDAWQKCGVSMTYSQQQAKLPEMKSAMPQYGEVNAQVLPDVVLRVDRAFQALFRRIQAGEAPG